MKQINRNAGINTKILKKIKRNIPGWVLIAPSVLLFFLIIWRPIAIGIGFSFFDLRGFEPVTFIGLKNYTDVLSDTNFVKTLINTLKYVGFSLLIGFPLPFIVAVLLNEIVHLKSYFKITTYLPVILPTIATAMIWRMIYMGGEGGLLNMVNYFFGKAPVDWLANKNMVIPLIIVSMTWNGFGKTMVVYLASLQGVNQELYEAARLDGAGVWQRFKAVIFPHMRGMLLLMLVSQMIGVFNITEQPLTMTGGGPNGASLSIGLTNYFYAFKYGYYGKSLATGVITFCMLLLLTIVYFVLDKKTDE